MRWRLPAIRLLRQRVALAVATVVSVALIVAVLGSRGMLHLQALTGEEAELGRRIGLLLRENEQLRERIHRLRTDDRTLERLAREQLGFTRPGEVIYRFGTRPNPGTETAP
jgi:cell division protein FtsB